jgi:hypothetical protein
VAFDWRPSDMQRHRQAPSFFVFSALLDLLHSNFDFAILQGTCQFWQSVGTKALRLSFVSDRGMPRYVRGNCSSLQSRISGSRMRMSSAYCKIGQVRLPALIHPLYHPLYVLVSKILSSILNSSALIHPLYHPLSTLFTVRPTCHFI